jgi:hypothetical protein
MLVKKVTRPSRGFQLRQETAVRSDPSRVAPTRTSQVADAKSIPLVEADPAMIKNSSSSIRRRTPPLQRSPKDQSFSEQKFAENDDFGKPYVSLGVHQIP